MLQLMHVKIILWDLSPFLLIVFKLLILQIVKQQNYILLWQQEHLVGVKLQKHLVNVNFQLVVQIVNQLVHLFGMIKVKLKHINVKHKVNVLLNIIMKIHVELIVQLVHINQLQHQVIVKHVQLVVLLVQLPMIVQLVHLDIEK